MIELQWLECKQQETGATLMQSDLVGIGKYAKLQYRSLNKRYVMADTLIQEWSDWEDAKFIPTGRSPPR